RGRIGGVRRPGPLPAGARRAQRQTAVVVGAGAMGGLSVAHLARGGIGRIIVVNRTMERAHRLAETAASHGVESAALELSRLPEAMSGADVVLSCTGAVGAVITLADTHRALADRDRAEFPAGERPLVFCDL